MTGRAAWVAMLLLWAAAAAGQQPEAPADDQNIAEPNTQPVRVNSVDGAFQVVFPIGCSKLVQRYNEPAVGEDVDADKVVSVYHYSCDRYGEKGAGCWVTATLGLRGADGEPAGAAEVVAEVRKVLEGFKAVLVNQQPISKDLGEDYGKVEGMDVLARAPRGDGQIWIRGLLYYSDIYVLVAWNESGGLWQDPDYQAFFASFLPYAEVE